MKTFKKIIHSIGIKYNRRSTRILKHSKRYFNRQAATYNLAEPSLCYNPVFDIIAKKAPANIRLLDVGCGNGIMLQRVADELSNIEKLTGVDISDKMVEEAKTRLSSYKCSIVEGTMETVKLRKDFYNIVLCMHSFHHYPAPLNTLKNINKVMSKNGVFILADNKKGGVDRWIYNWRLYRQGYPCGDMWIYSKLELKILARIAGFIMENYQNAGENSFIMTFRKL